MSACHGCGAQDDPECLLKRAPVIVTAKRFPTRLRPSPNRRWPQSSGPVIAHRAQRAPANDSAVLRRQAPMCALRPQSMGVCSSAPMPSLCFGR